MKTTPDNVIYLALKPGWMHNGFGMASGSMDGFIFSFSIIIFYSANLQSRAQKKDFVRGILNFKKMHLLKAGGGFSFFHCTYNAHQREGEREREGDKRKMKWKCHRGHRTQFWRRIWDETKSPSICQGLIKRAIIRDRRNGKEKETVEENN